MDTNLASRVTAPRDCTTEVQVWLTTKMAHCEEQRAFEERNHDSVRRVWLCGGQAVDTATLFGRACVSPFTANPSYLSLAYYPTDRVRPPLAVAALDVYQLYHRSLSFRRYIPRTLDPSLPPSDTSTSFSHLLSAKSALPPEVRLSICLASHPSVQHGRREAEALYLTVFDARPLGNDRCPKVGPTHAHCDICWLVDGVLRRETTRHVSHECPYSQLVLDPLVREFAMRVVHEGHTDTIATMPTSQLLTLFERLYTTGSTVDTPIAPAVAHNLAGCISRVLFARASSNAPRSPPAPLRFSPSLAYAEIVSLLQDRANHTFRFAGEQDNNLAILHPGIEPWLLEHGHVAEWQKAWSSLVGSDGQLQLPRRYDAARVGPSGGLGAPLCSPHVCLRLGLTVSTVTYRGPLPRPCPTRVHVCIRLSVGLVLGARQGPTGVCSPADPSSIAWPLPSDSPPEYAVEAIVAERVVRGSTHYQIRWSRHADLTWEPASALANTTALNQWIARSGDTFSFAMRGSVARILSVLDNCHGVPASRLHALRNLYASMDPNGVSLFRRSYPSSAGGIVGGRATYIDTRRKGNTFLSCPPIARTFIYGEYYDEIDMSRSHFTAVLGCYALSHQPAPITMLRYIDEPGALEADIESELSVTRPHFLYRLNLVVMAAAGVPSRDQTRRIDIRRAWLAKTDMKAKHIFAALINAPNPASWQEEFLGCPTICQLVTDIKRMVPSVCHHPLNTDYARALLIAGTDAITLHSLCLANLDEHALCAAAEALRAADIPTGLTINDSLTISRRHSSPLLAHEVGASACPAGSHFVPRVFRHLQVPAAAAYLRRGCTYASLGGYCARGFYCPASWTSTSPLYVPTCSPPLCSFLPLQ